MRHLPYPEWWKAGAFVTARDGSRGMLTQLPDGSWQVGMTASGGYILNPTSLDWFPEKRPEVTLMQIRRIVYEADRSFLQAFGRGGLLEWASVPESRRCGIEEPRPAPLHDDGLLAVREQLAHAITKVFESYVG